jgi:RecA-family ATPase
MNVHTPIAGDDPFEDLRKVLDRAHAVIDGAAIHREQRERDEEDKAWDVFDCPEMPPLPALPPLLSPPWLVANPEDYRKPPGQIGSLQLIDVGDWQGLPVPEREWIVPGWILPRAVTLIAGAGGTGKSLLIQQWLSAIALGDPFLGTRGTAPVPVLYVNCEDDTLELHRRQDAIAKAAGRQLSTYAGKVHLVARVGHNNPLGTVGDDGKFQSTALYRDIRDAALKIGAKVVALDNAMQHYVGNLNDPAAVTAFCNALARLALNINGAVILAGHVAKADGSQFAGTMAWENAVRTRLFLSRETDADGEEIEDSDRRYLTRGKGNYARKGDRLEMTWHAGAFYSESPENTGQDFADEQHESAFLRCLDEATAQRRNSSHSIGANYAPTLFATFKTAGGVKKKDLERAMSRLFDRSQIIANSYLWHDEKSRPKSGIKRAENVPDHRPEPVPHTVPKPPEPIPQTVPRTPPYTTYNGAGPDGPLPLTEYGASA